MADRRITDHIRAAARRTDAESAALTSRLLGHSWPGGGDRTEPVGREWVRRWSPATAFAAAARCSCATGRCATCN